MEQRKIRKNNIYQLEPWLANTPPAVAGCMVAKGHWEISLLGDSRYRQTETVQEGHGSAIRPLQP